MVYGADFQNISLYLTPGQKLYLQSNKAGQDKTNVWAENAQKLLYSDANQNIQAISYDA